MRLLLDTHTFMWLDDETEKLSLRVRTLCQDPDTKLFLSVASAWQIQIKAGLGKLPCGSHSLRSSRTRRRQTACKFCPLRWNTSWLWKVCRHITRTRLTVSSSRRRSWKV